MHSNNQGKTPAKLVPVNFPKGQAPISVLDNVGETIMHGNSDINASFSQKKVLQCMGNADITTNPWEMLTSTPNIHGNIYISKTYAVIKLARF